MKKIIFFISSFVVAIMIFSTCKSEISNSTANIKLADPEPPKDFITMPTQTIEGKVNENNHVGVFGEGKSITLNKFFISQFEVTQEEYAQIMIGQNVKIDDVEYVLNPEPSLCKEGSTVYALEDFGERAKRPVENVTWYDALYFCNAKSRAENLEEAYTIEVITVEQSGEQLYRIISANVTVDITKNGYRLPTEAEWEFAARGGDPSKDDWNYTFSGAPTEKDKNYDSAVNSGLDNVGWYMYNNVTGFTTESAQNNTNVGKGTHQVGLKAPNSLGLYDMCGNVWEWCCSEGDKVQKEDISDEDINVLKISNVVRGGSWNNAASFASVCYQGGVGWTADLHDDSLGFRVVRTVK